MSNPWSEKYKRSIDCKRPQGFSQRAHCQSRRKRNTQEARHQLTARGKWNHVMRFHHQDVDYEIMLDIRDSYKGEVFGDVYVYPVNKNFNDWVSRANISIMGKNVWLKYIETRDSHKRQGFASAILEFLEHQGFSVEFSSTTDSGEALRQSRQTIREYRTENFQIKRHRNNVYVVTAPDGSYVDFMREPDGYWLIMSIVRGGVTTIVGKRVKGLYRLKDTLVKLTRETLDMYEDKKPVETREYLILPSNFNLQKLVETCYKADSNCKIVLASPRADEQAYYIQNGFVLNEGIDRDPRWSHPWIRYWR